MRSYIPKTICGFLNAQGGKLLIGVDDDGNLVGLNSDYSHSRAPESRDHYERWFRECLGNKLSTFPVELISIEFKIIGTTEICIVSVKPLLEPVFVKDDNTGKYVFYIRSGNATIELSGPELLDYQHRRSIEKSSRNLR